MSGAAVAPSSVVPSVVGATGSVVGGFTSASVPATCFTSAFAPASGFTSGTAVASGACADIVILLF